MNELYKLVVKDNSGRVHLTRYYNSKKTFDKYHKSVLKKFLRSSRSYNIELFKTPVDWKIVK